MRKGLLLLGIALLFALAILSNVSAGYWNYPDYYSSYDKDSYYHINSAYSTTYHPWGVERTSYYRNEKTVVERNYYPSNYQYRYSSYWRYEPSYYPANYYNTYTKPYYYAPRYDPYLGYYNWRY